MTISQLILNYQKNHEFEDTVLEYLSSVQEEGTDEHCNIIWTFIDGSTLKLHNEVFYSIIDLTSQ